MSKRACIHLLLVLAFAGCAAEPEPQAEPERPLFTGAVRGRVLIKINDHSPIPLDDLSKVRATCEITREGRKHYCEFTPTSFIPAIRVKLLEAADPDALGELLCSNWCEERTAFPSDVDSWWSADQLVAGRYQIGAQAYPSSFAFGRTPPCDSAFSGWPTLHLVNQDADFMSGSTEVEIRAEETTTKSVILDTVIFDCDLQGLPD